MTAGFSFTLRVKDNASAEVGCNRVLNAVLLAHTTIEPTAI
jgi:hypothetical protein